jgi:hypothetical protein
MRCARRLRHQEGTRVFSGVEAGRSTESEGDADDIRKRRVAAHEEEYERVVPQAAFGLM